MTNTLNKPSLANNDLQSSLIMTSIPIDDLNAIIHRAVANSFNTILKEKEKIASDDNQFLTREEVANNLHISLQTLNKHLRSGKIAFKRIGRRVLISQNSINSFLTNPRRLK